MDVTVSCLQPEDVAQHLRLKAQAFEQNLGPNDPARPTPDNDRTIVAKTAGSTPRVVATATTLPLGQWFGGRSIAMGGVAGVAVAPERRGLGLARQVLTRSIEDMHERGEPISALFPTTSVLYRSLGYEFAGRWERTSFPTSELAAIVRDRRQNMPPTTDTEVQRLESGDMTKLQPVYDRLASQSNGWLDRSSYFWDRVNYLIDPIRSNSFGYLVLTDGQPVGGLTVTHRPGNDPLHFGLDIGGPLALTADAMTECLALIAGLATTADEATLDLPVEQLASSIPAAYLNHRDSWNWMLRLIDVGSALTARGYNPAVKLRLAFSLNDPVAPWNSGHWSVEIADGSAKVKRSKVAPAQAFEIDLATFAGLYTGFLSPWDLSVAGRLPGANHTTLTALSAAFAGPPSRLVDFF